MTLTLEDEIDISRGDMITRRRGRCRRSVSAPTSCGWTNGRSTRRRVYLLKHTTRTVTAEVDHALVLNQIGSVTVSTARPVMFDRYVDNRGTGSFILIDPATNFTAGAGMIAEVLREAVGGGAARAPRNGSRGGARSVDEDEAVEAVRKALEEILS